MPCQHKPDVYIDLSGWSPKYFPDILVRYCNSILRKKLLFGSDGLMITLERWLSDFEKIAIKDELRDDITKGNAVRLLGLALSDISRSGLWCERYSRTGNGDACASA